MEKGILTILLVTLLVIPSALAISFLPSGDQIARFYLSNSQLIDFIIIFLPMFAVAQIGLKQLGKSGQVIAIVFAIVCGLAWSYYSMQAHKTLIGSYLTPIFIIMGVNFLLIAIEYFRARNHSKITFYIFGLAWFLLWPILRNFLAKQHGSIVSTVLTIGNLSMLFLGLGFIYLIFSALSKNKPSSPHFRSRNPWSGSEFTHPNREVEHAERHEREELADIENRLNRTSQEERDEDRRIMREIQENSKLERNQEEIQRMINKVIQLINKYDRELHEIESLGRHINQLSGRTPEEIREISRLKLLFDRKLHENHLLRQELNTLLRNIEGQLRLVQENLIDQINTDRLLASEERTEALQTQTERREAEQGHKELKKEITRIRKEMQATDRWHSNTEGEKREKQKKLKQLTAEYRKLMKGDVDFKKLIHDLSYDFGIDKNEEAIQKKIDYLIKEEIQITDQEMRMINKLLSTPPDQPYPIGGQAIEKAYEKMVLARKKVNDYLRKLKQEQSLKERRNIRDEHLH